jgi:hypothetical protein
MLRRLLGRSGKPPSGNAGKAPIGNRRNVVTQYRRSKVSNILGTPIGPSLAASGAAASGAAASGAAASGAAAEGHVFPSVEIDPSLDTLDIGELKELYDTLKGQVFSIIDSVNIKWNSKKEKFKKTNFKNSSDMNDIDALKTAIINFRKFIQNVPEGSVWQNKASTESKSYPGIFKHGEFWIPGEGKLKRVTLAKGVGVSPSGSAAAAAAPNVPNSPPSPLHPGIQPFLGFLESIGFTPAQLVLIEGILSNESELPPSFPSKLAPLIINVLLPRANVIPTPQQQLEIQREYAPDLNSVPSLTPNTLSLTPNLYVSPSTPSPTPYPTPTNLVGSPVVSPAQPLLLGNIERPLLLQNRPRQATPTPSPVLPDVILLPNKTRTPILTPFATPNFEPTPPIGATPYPTPTSLVGSPVVSPMSPFGGPAAALFSPGVQPVLVLPEGSINAGVSTGLVAGQPVVQGPSRILLPANGIRQLPFTPRRNTTGPGRPNVAARSMLRNIPSHMFSPRRQRATRKGPANRRPLPTGNNVVLVENVTPSPVPGQPATPSPIVTPAQPLLLGNIERPLLLQNRPRQPTPTPSPVLPDVILLPNKTRTPILTPHSPFNVEPTPAIGVTPYATPTNLVGSPEVSPRTPTPESQRNYMVLAQNPYLETPNSHKFPTPTPDSYTPEDLFDTPYYSPTPEGANYPDGFTPASPPGPPQSTPVTPTPPPLPPRPPQGLPPSRRVTRKATPVQKGPGLVGTAVRLGTIALVANYITPGSTPRVGKKVAQYDPNAFLGQNRSWIHGFTPMPPTSTALVPTQSAAEFLYANPSLVETVRPGAPMRMGNIRAAAVKASALVPVSGVRTHSVVNPRTVVPGLVREQQKITKGAKGFIRYNELKAKQAAEARALVPVSGVRNHSTVNSGVPRLVTEKQAVPKGPKGFTSFFTGKAQEAESRVVPTGSVRTLRQQVLEKGPIPTAATPYVSVEEFKAQQLGEGLRRQQEALTGIAAYGSTEVYNPTFQIGIPIPDIEPILEAGAQQTVDTCLASQGNPYAFKGCTAPGDFFRIGGNNESVKKEKRAEFKKFVDKVQTATTEGELTAAVADMNKAVVALQNPIVMSARTGREVQDLFAKGLDSLAELGQKAAVESYKASEPFLGRLYRWVTGTPAQKVALVAGPGSGAVVGAAGLPAAAGLGAAELHAAAGLPALPQAPPPPRPFNRIGRGQISFIPGITGKGGGTRKLRKYKKARKAHSKSYKKLIKGSK